MVAATVSAGYFTALLDFAQLSGAVAESILKETGVEGDELSDPDQRIAFGAYIAAMRAAIRHSGDPAFALRLGAHADFDEVTIVGLICYSATDMMDAFVQLNRYGKLVADVALPTPGERFRLTPTDTGLWFEDTRTAPEEFPELTEQTWSRFICENRRNFPGVPFAREVHVPHGKPAHWREYERVLEVPVFFSSSRNALLIEPSWAQVKLSKPNRYAFGVLSERADALVKALEDEQSMIGRVEKLLIPNLHKGEITMDWVASELCIGRQTLYRRLRDEGVGFAGLLDGLRHRMAVSYLEDGKASLNEITYLVGFSEVSAFSRAFKRWKGKAPGKYR